jgi:hypothetical protein
MTPEGFRKDLAFRRSRTMTLSPWQRSEFDAALKAVCDSEVRTYFFFPPDHIAMLKIYLANDTHGLLKFMFEAQDDVQAHNTRCRGKVKLFDFLYPNDITKDPVGPGGAEHHLDLIHFRPPTGLRLLRRMLGATDVGFDLTTAQRARF